MTLSTAGDKPLLYCVAVCPYAQRTKILLDIKGVAYQEVEINSAKPRPQALLDVNQVGKALALIHKGKAPNKSRIINKIWALFRLEVNTL